MQLKSELEEARRRLETLEKIVSSERKAKMAAVEHAAKVAAAAEALASAELSDSAELSGSASPSRDGRDADALKSKSVKQLALEAKTASDTAAAETAEDALMSPSTRGDDDAAALLSMRTKTEVQMHAAERALAKATAGRFEREKRLADERAKWERVLTVANAEAAKAAASAAAREADLRRMFDAQAARARRFDRN